MGHFSSYNNHLRNGRRMNISRRSRKRFFLASGIIAYLSFHAVREDLATGLFQASFPSLLFIPVTLALVDEFLHHTSRRADWSEQRSTIIFATITGIFFFEIVGPHISSRVVGDFRDSVALVFGGLIYFLVVNTSSINKRPEQVGAVDAEEAG